MGLIAATPAQYRTGEPRGFHLSLRDSPPTPVGVGNIGLLSKCMFPCVTGCCFPTIIFTLFEPLTEMFQHGYHPPWG